MKHIIALVLASFAISHAADWYAGARVGHAFVDNKDYPNIEKPIEYGGKFGVYFRNGIGAELGADIISGEKQGHSYNYFSGRPQEIVMVNDSIKTSCINYSLAFQVRKNVFRELFCYLKGGVIISRQEYNHFNSSNEDDWKKTNGTKIGELVMVGGEYLVAKHIGLNASADYRRLPLKYSLNATVISAGINYPF